MSPSHGQPLGMQWAPPLLTPNLSRVPAASPGGCQQKATDTDEYAGNSQLVHPALSLLPDGASPGCSRQSQTPVLPSIYGHLVSSRFLGWEAAQPGSAWTRGVHAAAASAGSFHVPAVVPPTRALVNMASQPVAPAAQISCPPASIISSVPGSYTLLGMSHPAQGTAVASTSGRPSTEGLSLHGQAPFPAVPLQHGYPVATFPGVVGHPDGACPPVSCPDTSPGKDASSAAAGVPHRHARGAQPLMLGPHAAWPVAQGLLEIRRGAPLGAAATLGPAPTQPGCSSSWEHCAVHFPSQPFQSGHKRAKATAASSPAASWQARTTVSNHAASFGLPGSCRQSSTENAPPPSRPPLKPVSTAARQAGLPSAAPGRGTQSRDLRHWATASSSRGTCQTSAEVAPAPSCMPHAPFNAASSRLTHDEGSFHPRAEGVPLPSSLPGPLTEAAAGGSGQQAAAAAAHLARTQPPVAALALRDSQTVEERGPEQPAHANALASYEASFSHIHPRAKLEDPPCSTSAGRTRPTEAIRTQTTSISHQMEGHALLGLHPLRRTGQEMEHHLSPTLQPLRGTNRHGASSAPAGKPWSIVGGGSATGAVPERLPSGEVSTPSAASEDCAIEVPSIREALRMPGHARMHASELAAVPQSPLSTPSSRLAPSLSADQQVPCLNVHQLLPTRCQACKRKLAYAHAAAPCLDEQAVPH